MAVWKSSRLQSETLPRTVAVEGSATHQSHFSFYLRGSKRTVNIKLLVLGNPLSINKGICDEQTLVLELIWHMIVSDFVDF